jgi:hypothetical protein
MQGRSRKTTMQGRNNITTTRWEQITQGASNKTIMQGGNAQHKVGVEKQQCKARMNTTYKNNKKTNKHNI